MGAAVRPVEREHSTQRSNSSGEAGFGVVEGAQALWSTQLPSVTSTTGTREPGSESGTHAQPNIVKSLFARQHIM